MGVMPRGWYGTTRDCADCGTPFVLKSKWNQTLCSLACAARRNTGKRKSTRIPWQERFRAFVPAERTAKGCLEWTGYRDKHGYGRLARGGKHGGVIKAPRAAYELARGPIPPGKSVLHSCDNPPCVEPSHLFLGTKKDNTQDMLAKGRESRLTGTANPRTKMSDATVQAMRERAAAGESLASLGREYGIASKHVWAIVAGRRRAAAGGPIRA